MQKKLLFIILGLFIFQTSFSQEAIAKLKFEDAEEAYNKEEYATTLSKLDDAEKILGKKNIPKILYLRIMAHSKQLASATSIDLEQIATLRNNCNTYLTENESNTALEEKFKDVYKTMEGFKEYEPFDEIVKGAKAGNTKDMVKLGRAYWRSLENIKKAKEWLLAAKEKEVAAIRLLGQIEKDGNANNAKPDYKKSLEYLLDASAKNDAIAIYNVSLAYRYPTLSNNTITKDTVLANEYFEKSFKEGLKQAEAGDDEAMNLMGILYDFKSNKEYDRKKSFKWFSKAAEKNNILAIKMLARAYQYGSYDETPKNIEKAIYYYNLAVSNGDFPSMENLGYIYGNIEPINHKKSLEWYQKAADKGLVFAMYKIAVAYSSGENEIATNYEAVNWCTKSANKGNRDAMLLLGNFYYFGWGVTKNYNTAKDWYYKSAINGNSLGYQSLGVLYTNGVAFPIDLNTALEWYLKGAELNNAECVYEASSIYLQLKQYDKAFQYCTMGAEKGYRGCLHGLGEIYYKGLGIKKDYEKAFTYFSQSAENGWPPAMQMLSKLYMDGDGVKKDKKLAAEWQEKFEAAKAKK